MGYSGSLNWLTARPIAHRGLHDGNLAVPENSLVAAAAAITAGCAIECDVQISADGSPYVFHDDGLERLCGRQCRFRDADDAELNALRLAGTDEVIPTVAAFLDLVAGRVPVVMELKGLGGDEDARYVAQLAPVIERYSGALALMSFDEWLIDQMLDAALPRPIGITAEGLSPDHLARHRAIFERGCRFVSYNVQHLPNAFVDWVRQECRAPVICWTVRTPDDIARSDTKCDQMTFEGFAPQH